MLDQLVARQRWRNLCLTLTVLALALLAALPADAQFQAERAIDPLAPSLQYGRYHLTVDCAEEPTACDIVLFGYQNRRPGRWSAVKDTLLQLVPHRRHTVVGHKRGHMFHTESFWPDLLRKPEIHVALRPLEKGLRTDILGIHFIGNQDRIHPKSLDVAEELLDWLQDNPGVRLKVIGHVNGADGRRSKAFYRRASVRRAEVLAAWLVQHGVQADRLEVAGEGADALLFPDPLHAWQHEANRRVEIEVLGH